MLGCIAAIALPSLIIPSASTVVALTSPLIGPSTIVVISLITSSKSLPSFAISEGFVVTVHGKGTYVAATNKELLLEEQKKELEADLERAIQKGRRCGISDEDIKSLFELILEG